MSRAPRDARTPEPTGRAARIAGAVAAVLGAAILLALAFAMVARAQGGPARGGAVTPARAQPTIVTIGPAGTPAPLLDPVLIGRIRRAQAMREMGLSDSARVILTDVLRSAPHHPMVLGELARLLEERRDWPALERLATAERAATRDSTLLAQSLALAYERTARLPLAAQTAIEAWVASSAQGEWAQSTLARLSPADARAVREPLRRAAEKRPARTDLARALARLDWAAGDGRSVLRTLQAADRSGARPPLRWAFADDLLRAGAGRDSAGAVDVLVDLAGDATSEVPYRTAAAQRAWETALARGSAQADAPRLARALAGVPAERWEPRMRLGLARALREGGLTREARGLLDAAGTEASSPDVWLERALADLRDGPPERALPALRTAAGQGVEGAWRYAEALFYAGQPDSAKTWYQHVADDAASPFAGAAFERLFLIEDADPKSALPLFGRLAYEQWRGEAAHAEGLADSLYRSLPRGATWAQSALALAALRDARGDARAALVPLVAVADSLPGDRLAPLARQRIGDLYLFRIKDEAQALAQYEECLARYPKAWNTPEVRRRVESLRRERRF